MGENIYMLPSDMNLKIKTGSVGYNNKVLVSDSKFSIEKNDKVNPRANAEGAGSTNALKLASAKISHKDSKVVAQTTTTHRDSNDVAQKPTITQEEEKIALILCLTGAFTIWYILQ